MKHSSFENLLLHLSQYNIFGILGFGKEGKSFLDFLFNNKNKNINSVYNTLEVKKIIIFDKYLTQKKLDIYLKNTKNIKNTNIKIILYSGENYLEHLAESEITVKAPGVSCFHENIRDEDIKKYNITSLSNLFLTFFGHQTIGITGTKGKSTTASLLHHLFTSAGKKSFLVGNIGKPTFDILENITDETVVIHEFSSHQLEKITVGPKVAILLNLYPEHLDYYENKEKYFNAKKNIFLVDNSKQSEAYISIENFNFVQNIDEYNLRTNKYFFNKHTENNTKNNIENNTDYISKIHNISLHTDTIRVAKIISDIYNLFETEKFFIENVNNFISLPHRLEIVEVKNTKNILYINDSISTIPESTIEGIIAAKKLETIQGKRLETIILGGFDRGVCLEKLIHFVLEAEIKNIFLIAETGKILEKKFNTYIQNNINIHKKSTNYTVLYKENLADIMPLVREYSSKNSICLFSPSASSFDQYKNFEDRGNDFRVLAKTLEKTND